MNKQGETLVEVILAMALLAIVFLPLSSLYSTPLRANFRAEEKLEATMLAQKCMEELRGMPDPVKAMKGGGLASSFEENGYWIQRTATAITDKNGLPVYGTTIFKEKSPPPATISLASDRGQSYCLVENKRVDFIQEKLHIYLNGSELLIEGDGHIGVPLRRPIVIYSTLDSPAELMVENMTSEVAELDLLRESEASWMPVLTTGGGPIRLRMETDGNQTAIQTKNLGVALSVTVTKEGRLGSKLQSIKLLSPQKGAERNGSK